MRERERKRKQRINLIFEKERERKKVLTQFLTLCGCERKTLFRKNLFPNFEKTYIPTF
jgi:ribosome biogenesis GTPase A